MPASCTSWAKSSQIRSKHERDRDDPLTAGQRGGVSALFAEARQRPDLGAGVIWQPAGGGARPSAIYARGVTSLETAALAKCAARGETPLRADLHVVAARLTATLETGADGLLRARLMEPAPEGTVARDGVDSLGESTQRLARWQRGR